MLACSGSLAKKEIDLIISLVLVLPLGQEAGSPERRFSALTNTMRNQGTYPADPVMKTQWSEGI
ncbi:hypothetical protein CIPAW_04G159900 [Carya illinoinensis]|uniref:Uncharacterized protein n=1 Tax=Carya illinoinensis TaxID=32201 RepID=A0A8T1QTU7_CARIL|nr:hypothetical protein CIPAW_04G159900 [Carya illinoinensis]